jgi:diacylglycerol kinase family enzyme
VPEKDCFFIFNPGSRGGRSGKLIGKILGLLREHGVRCAYKITETLEDAYRFSLDANNEGFPMIVAVGGDGTINRALNGFYREDGTRVSRSFMGVVYTGTSPDFCKSCGIPYNDVDASVRCLLRRGIKRIDIGRVTFSAEPARVGHTLTRYFACCANVGLGADLASYANGGIRKYLGDTAGTFVSLIRTLIAYRPAAVRITRDDVEETIEGLFNLSIGRTRHIASGIKVTHDLEPGDGRFYLLTVKNLGLGDLPSCFRQIYGGNPIENSDTIAFSYCRKIEIGRCDRNPRIEFDGDPQGYLPCAISMATEPLDLVVDDDA